MLYLVTGASGAGKSTVLDPLRVLVPDQAMHDYDVVGLPTEPNKRWRQRTNELWVQQALRYQKRGQDLILFGQTPLGELLATPSSTRLDGIAACLLDCEETVRRERLPILGEHHLQWAHWLRHHAQNPQHQQDVLKEDAPPRMHWERWDRWQRGDPRWQVLTLDTSLLGIAEVAGQLADWMHVQGELFRHGQIPLSGEWWVAGAAQPSA